MTDTAKGLIALISANLVWGLSPLYWKMLAEVPALVVLGHRSLWSLVVFGGYLALTGRAGRVTALLASPALARVAFAAAMIAINWGIFIWAVQVGRTVEASLGYYTFPLVAVLFGIVFFRERLDPWKAAAIALATLAVATLGFGLGAPPWISLALAVTFAAYGAIKKGLDAGPIVSVTAEIALIMPLLAALALWQGQGALWPGDLKTQALLAASGLISLTPLVLFSYGAQRLTLATTGIAQYTNPTLQFAVAVAVFAEPVTRWHWIAFPLIWVAVGLYSLGVLRASRAARRRVSSPATSSTGSM